MDVVRVVWHCSNVSQVRHMLQYVQQKCDLCFSNTNNNINNVITFKSANKIKWQQISC